MIVNQILTSLTLNVHVRLLTCLCLEYNTINRMNTEPFVLLSTGASNRQFVECWEEAGQPSGPDPAGKCPL